MDLPMQQRIEFCVEELLLLRSAPSLRVALEVCFLYGSDEAFHALCSLLLFGRDLCSPNKRIKAEAKLDFYSKLLAKHHPHCKLPHSRHMTYSEFASSLGNMNDRWTTTYTMDELISLAYIVDIDEQGVISYDTYLRFTSEVERAARSNINDPKESLDAMYDHRREVLYAHHVMTAIDLPELRDKLASLAVLASQCSLQPLQSLHELPVLADQETSPNDSLIGFLLELSDVVNSSLDADPDAQGSSMDASYQLTGIGFDSPQLPPTTDNHHMIRIIDGGMLLPPDTQHPISSIKQHSSYEDVTAPTHTAAAVAEADSNPVSAAACVSNRSNPSYSESSSNHQEEEEEEDIPVEQSPAPAAVVDDDDDDDALIIEAAGRNGEVASTMHIEASTMDPQSSSQLLPHREQTLLETIHSVQKQTVEVSSQLQRSLGSAEIVEKLDSLESELKQALEQMKVLLAVKEADHSVKEERKHHPDAQSNTAEPPLSPIDNKPVFADDSSTPVPVPTRASSVALLSGTPVVVTAAAASQYIATSPVPMVKPPTIITSSASTILNSRGRKAEPTATNRITSFKYSHSQHNSLISCHRGSSSSSSVSTVSGSTNRSMKRVDLDIFKSPRRFQTSLNRNIYSDSKLTWVPSQETTKAHARKRSDRFHSTEEVMFAKKVNQVFYKVVD